MQKFSWPARPGGQRNASDTNTVLLFVGLSPGDHVCASVKDPSPGWWEWMVDAGKPLDTDACHVICVNRLGSCFGSTSPASINPATRKPYGSDFPELSIGDMARITVRRALVVGLESDTLYPIHQQRALADLLCEQGHDFEFVVMPSIQGLDAFLVGCERFAPVLERFLADDALLTEAAPYQVSQCAAVS